jgi:O-antigen/teichoic acid export membrane protein
MSRTSRVLASVSLGYVQLALSTTFGLWFTPVLLHRVGQSDFGLWAAGMPILAYVGLVDFGVLTIFQRDVAFALGEARGDPANLSTLRTLVGTTLRLVLLQMPLLLAAVALAWLCLPKAWAGLHVPLAITFACLVLTFPLRIYHALLLGLQDLRFIAVVSMITWSLGALTSVVFVLLGWRLSALAVSWCTSQLFLYVVCLLRVRSRHPHALGGGIARLPRADAVARLRKGFWVTVSQVTVLVAGGIDLLVIASLLGPSAVTPYTITDKLVTMLNNVPLMIMAAAQPALSELSRGADRRRLSDICVALTRAVLLVSGLIATVVVIVDQGFVGWWIGPLEFGGRPLVVLLVVDMLVIHWSTATAYALFSFGYERIISVLGVLFAAVAAASMVFLVGHFGPMGAPLASILVRGPILLVMLFVTGRAAGGGFRSLLFSVVPWLWRLVILLAAGALVTRAWVPHTVLQLSGAGAAATAIYALVMSPLVLSDPLGPYMKPRFAALRRRLARALSTPAPRA